MIKPDGLVASNKIEINIEKIDGGKALKALAKTAFHFIVPYNISAGVNASIELLEALVASPELDRLAYRLYITAMKEAIESTIKQVGTPSSEDDDENVNNAIAQLPKTFWFDKNSIDDPCSSQFYKDMESCFIGFLGDNVSDKGFARHTLSYYFTEALRNEWRSNTTKYQSLHDYLNTPFDNAVAKEECWITYAETLNNIVSKSVFDENYGLKDIYMPLNAYYTKKSDNSKQKHEPEIKEHYVHELEPLINDWLDNATGEDAYRIISGEPGSGKSTFAKMFSAKRIKDTQLVYVPLDELDVHEGFKTAFENYLRDEDLPDDLLTNDRKLLIILDGLDELTEQGKAVARTAYDFVNRVMRDMGKINSKSMRIWVLFTGRVPAVQETEGLFADHPEQILHLLPYYTRNADSPHFQENFVDPNNLLKHDYRKDWWEGYTRASGKPADIPSDLLSDSMDDLTSSPLLLHLVALYYAESGSVPENKASLYTELLEGVFNRAPRGMKKTNRPPLHNRFDSVTDYMDVLSDVAVAMWHNTGRKVSLADARKYCEDNGRVTLLEKLSDTAKSDDGLTNLFMMFYGRKIKHAGDNEMFEFTHKSFGEFLVARRIVDELASIAEGLLINSEHFRTEDALDAWVKICGHTTLDMAIAEFIRDQVALIANKEKAAEWQKIICRLIDHVVKDGMPFIKYRPATFKEEQRVARNSEIALLVMHSACAWVTEDVVAIEWEDEGAASEWFKWLQCGEWTKIIVVNRHLNHLNLKKCLLDFNNFEGATFTGTHFGMPHKDYIHFYMTSMLEADLSNVDFCGSTLGYTKLDRAIFNNAILDNSSFYSSFMEYTDLNNAKHYNAKFINTSFRDSKLPKAMADSIKLYKIPYGGNIINKNNTHMKK